MRFIRDRIDCISYQTRASYSTVAQYRALHHWHVDQAVPPRAAAGGACGQGRGGGGVRTGRDEQFEPEPQHAGQADCNQDTECWWVIHRAATDVSIAISCLGEISWKECYPRLPLRVSLSLLTDCSFSPPPTGMSDHPDFDNLRSLGTTWYDPSSEPGRWQSYTTITDIDQVCSVGS